MKKIFVVEDDKDIQEVLFSFLADAGYDVTLASDGVEAISVFPTKDFDLVLLDILLPTIDGYGVCEYIRKLSNIPIIMLTALDSETEQMKGFEHCIDDYITKPFSIPILMKKIEAILRRSTKTQDNQRISFRNLEVDVDNCIVSVDKKVILLTPREFGILVMLLMNKGRVISRQQLLNGLWEYDFYGDERVVDTHVKNLRKKLNVDYIETIRGFGYRIDKEN